MDWSQILKEAGPYTAPLCAAMGLAIKWLLSERKELIASLSRSQEREREMGEKRTKELLESATALGESALVVEKALEKHDRMLERVVEKWEPSVLSS